MQPSCEDWITAGVDDDSDADDCGRRRGRREQDRLGRNHLGRLGRLATGMNDRDLHYYDAI